MNKKIFNRISVAVFPLAAMLSCQDSVRVDIPVPEDQMHLAVSTDYVELSFFGSESDAVTVSWAPSGYREQGIPCEYHFKMDVSGNGFANSIRKIDVSGQNAISFTGIQIKSYLDRWEIPAGTKTRLEAEVIATPIEAEEISDRVFRMPEVSKVEFDVVCLEETVTLIIEGQVHNFVNDMLYARLSQPGTVRCQAGDSSYKDVEVYEEGLWCFSLDYTNRTVNMARPQVWLLGDATDTGWELGTMNEFSIKDNNSALKYWKGNLKQGEIKFPLSQNFEGNFNIPYIMPFDNGAAPGQGPVMFVPAGTPDNKWAVPSNLTGEYEITLDLKNMTIDFNLLSHVFVPQWSRIWMVGDATSGGWESTPFQIELNKKGGGIFTFEGHLSQGEFKFPLEERTFEVPYLMPKNVNDEGLALLPDDGQSCEIKYVERYGPDHKWKVNGDREGDYLLTLNLENMTMTVNKK